MTTDKQITLEMVPLSAIQQVGWLEKQVLIWVKDSFVLGRQDYHWQHEPCLYGWKSGASHYFVSDFSQSTILESQLETKSNQGIILSLIKKALFFGDVKAVY